MKWHWIGRLVHGGREHYACGERQIKRDVDAGEVSERQRAQHHRQTPEQP
jgi:hypothetical protein